jgi:hypothetical protein
MTRQRAIVLTMAVGALICVAAVCHAQTPTPPRPLTDSSAPRTVGGCPGGNGIRIATTTGTPSDSASGLNTIISPSQSVDTTLVFNISQKTWTRTNLASSITAGLADESRGSYSICAGVTALLSSATLTIRNARGRVHFIASLKSLTDALRLGPGASSPQQRRM